MSARVKPRIPDVEGMARRFNQARQHANLTLSELEKKSGCAMSMLSGISIGDRMPRVDSVAKIARALGVSAGWLAYGEGIAPDWLDGGSGESRKVQ